ncbi:MAG: hypothetical protein ABWZ91_11910 [Nocardioides sp.]
MTQYLISFDDGAMDFPEEISPTLPRPRRWWSVRPRRRACGSSAAA